MNQQQTPGRVEALRAVLRNGINNSTPEMLRIAGFGKPSRPRPVTQPHDTITFASGIDQLSKKDRAALPF